MLFLTTTYHISTNGTDAADRSFAADDAAHLLGTSASSLTDRAAHIRNTLQDMTPKSPTATPKSSSKTSLTKNAAGQGLGSIKKPPIAASLGDFLKGATSAQQAQIKMICRVFEMMDADGDKVLSVSDVRAYFRTIGRSANDHEVRRWIVQRDVDQDGAVSLPEFVASYTPLLDPSSKSTHSKGTAIPPTFGLVSPLATSFGALCLGNSPLEVQQACTAAKEYLHRVLDAPSVQSFWRVFINDEGFQKRIGRLFGGIKFMQSLGFETEQNGAVLALRDPSGKVWNELPNHVKVVLNSRLEELRNLASSLDELSISNIASGMYI